MFKVFLVGVLLCSSSFVFAQEEQSALANEAVQNFLAKTDIEKQSFLMDLLSVKQYKEAKSFLSEWEKLTPQGKGPSEFLKTYINDLIKSSN